MSYSHGEVAKATGYSVPMVSRLRRGIRKPTLESMRRMERAYGWPMCDQTAVSTEDWHGAFEAMLENHHDEARRRSDDDQA